jgi:hypothetical protein
MITKWLHISELGGDPWVLPIWTAVNKSVKAGRIQAPSSDVYRLGLNISTRLNILPRVVQRVNSSVALLYGNINGLDPKYISTEAKQGYAYPLDNDLKYSLLADIDALLFELNSVCELMTRLFDMLRAYVDQPIPSGQVGKAISDVLSQGGKNANWFVSLDKHRNFFMHEGAPYIAVDLSSDPTKLDVLIMKENIRTFTDSDTFVVLSEINFIIQGFIASKKQLQNYLVSLFK